MQSGHVICMKADLLLLFVLLQVKDLQSMMKLMRSNGNDTKLKIRTIDIINLIARD